MPDHDPETERCRRTAKVRQFVAAFVASLLGFTGGSVLGWTSPMQPLLMSPDPPVGTDPMTEDNVAWLGSINFVGTFLGSFFWGIVADSWGRKKTACLVAIPFILHWILTMVAKNFYWLIIARLIAGIGNNGAVASVPAFISEMAQDDLRGFFGSFYVIFINIGMMYSYVIGTYFHYYGLSIACIVIPLIFLLSFIWIPESPIFLFNNGQTANAEKSLFWYKGGDAVEAEKVLSTYKHEPNSKNNKLSVMSLFATRGTTKAFILGLALMISLQICGITAIMSFAVSIFEMCGTSLTPYHSALLLGSMQVVFTCSSSFLVDRLGRKFLLVTSMMVMAFSLAVLGTYLFFLHGQSVDSVFRWTPVVSLSVCVSAFAIGVSPVTFIIMGEIFPTYIKSYAIAKLLMVLGTTAFIFVKCFPIMKSLLKPHGLFWLYAVSSLAFSIFFYYHLPETKGKSLSEILRILNNKGFEDNLTEEKGTTEHIQLQ
ncbi:facilitated trehalose transporter Tret1-like isoform X1 [Homalodisca vitripennis]|uniref:facilitated trehalose transporter Tret1-like isoform X1 n=1 Tax=Homalodisca vitripennis TaxID=197043 RepID=UPI001EEA2949|nr:facilitated trehalose transporter Tret1-like isoform X1 [Homalodisca vitripennis]